MYILCALDVDIVTICGVVPPILCSGPFLVLALAREDAVDEWRKALGPKVVEEAKEKEPGSLRAQYSVEDAPLNQLHGSETVEDADRELQFFFPPEQTVAVIKPSALSEKGELSCV